MPKILDFGQYRWFREGQKNAKFWVFLNGHCVHVLTDYDGKKVFWAYKTQVFNISDDGFLKTKNQSRTQVKKNGNIFEDNSKIS